MSGTIIQTVTSSTPTAEKETRNNQDMARVSDPDSQRILMQILKELQKLNLQLSIITEEEI